MPYEADKRVPYGGLEEYLENARFELVRAARELLTHTQDEGQIAVLRVVLANFDPPVMQPCVVCDEPYQDIYHDQHSPEISCPDGCDKLHHEFKAEEEDIKF